ncbi:hypothetical protein DSC45_14695 [Streptomyces sp. YIM 130001]|uniref:hypothetical protein n=1 Tax=Streptomyces sp. YIM 130001 TaxID=2259644 RepID=UPI000E6489DA|nr:hypothetical protein [Streptomyces sp. YIM 130001]RII17009.1 hypothetical protein DSC45_14695 [Streptomyces sp. YIM 130001]
MTVCAMESAAADGAVRREFTIAADGSYAARLAPVGDAWRPERWTLDGPEPYVVPLPLDQPEEPGTEVLPMADGRVLVHRETGVPDARSGPPESSAVRHRFSLLYPTGPGTGEVPLGSVEADSLTLLAPTPGGSCAYALAPGPDSTAVWQVAGSACGPEYVADIPGHCTGGVWLDRAGRMLALDQELAGRTKTVSVDLERGGEVAPLLEITEESNDRLLLADPDSGLILVRSDAAGYDRLGWGVLDSTLPVRFPDALRLPDCAVTPFAVQGGQPLLPESCAVAFRIDGAAGSWIGLWRPAQRQLHQIAAPHGWLCGTGLFSPEGVLRLPYATEAVPCGVATITAPPAAAPGSPAPGAVGRELEHARGSASDTAPEHPSHEGSGDPGDQALGPDPVPPGEALPDGVPDSAPDGGTRPVPLQQAPLTGRVTAG